jgi:cytochrome c553
MKNLEMVGGSEPLEGGLEAEVGSWSAGISRDRKGLASLVTGAALAAIAGTLWLAPVAAFAQNAALPAVAPKPDAAKGEQLATQVCAACHGPDGNSTAPTNPKIAAQHPAYLRKQLAEFKPKEGGKPADRPNPIMSAIASPLSEEDMANLALYYAGKPLKASVARNKDLAELGRDIYRGGIAEKGVPACAGCHGPAGSGIPGQYPRLGGQYSDYTEAQLVAFRSGGRHNNVAMVTIASRLTDREVKALADYIAGLR